MRIITTLLMPVIFICITGCSSPKKERKLAGNDVLRMINNYETDTLRAIMDKAFIMDFDYIAFQGNAKTFLEETMPSSKSIEAYYEIIEARKPADGNFQYIVKDRSAFDKHFRLDPPKLLLSIIINDSNRFEKIYVDSLPGYKQYDRELANKFTSFQSWLKEKYPDEKLQDLIEDQSGKMVTLLKEYGKQ